jgi:hypothetical protein
MLDAFISYARADQALAKELAQYLQSLGFQVWWDTELLGSDDFNDVIYAALSNARAVVVIWSEHAVKSGFVRDEARFALQNKKLVTTKTPGLAIASIPFGFQGQHAEDVANYDKIVMAIERLGAQRTPHKPDQDLNRGTGEVAAWARAMHSNNPDELISFLGEYPQSQRRELAKKRLQELLAKASETETGAGVDYLRGSNVSAFISGLTFGVWEFLPIASRGLAPAPIGLAIGYFIALILLLLLIGVMQGPLKLNNAGTAVLWVPCVVIACILTWTHFHKLVRRHLFIAALIAGLISAILATFVVAGVATIVMAEKFDNNNNIYALFFFGLPMLSFAYVLWRMWQAR